MASVSQKYVLVGPHKGKTLAVNGHEFVDGEFTFHGSAEQVANLTRVFDNYAAIPAEAAELILAKQALEERDRLEKQPLTRVALDAALAKLPDGNTDPEYVVGAMRSYFGALFTADDEARVRGLVKPAPAPIAIASVGGSNDTPAPPVPGKPTLAEAIGALSWEQETHWTSNNLPSVDLLSEMTGRKVSRADVEAVAAGYTRSKAKALSVQ